MKSEFSRIDKCAIAEATIAAAYGISRKENPERAAASGGRPTSDSRITAGQLITLYGLAVLGQWNSCQLIAYALERFQTFPSCLSREEAQAAIDDLSGQIFHTGRLP